MTSLSAAVHGIDATTSALQKELPLLEQLQQDLEKELAAVSERVLSVRTALTALLALAETPAPRAVQEAEPASSGERSRSRDFRGGGSDAGFWCGPRAAKGRQVALRRWAEDRVQHERG